LHFKSIILTTISMQAFFQNIRISAPHRYNPDMTRGPKPSKEAPFFGRQLARFRQQRGMTQQEFADELGISRELIGHYERRCENPSVEFIIKAATSLGITIDELLGIAPERERPGPSPKAQKLAERLSRMPRSKQAIILNMIEGAIDKAS